MANAFDAFLPDSGASSPTVAGMTAGRLDSSNTFFTANSSANSTPRSSTFGESELSTSATVPYALSFGGRRISTGSHAQGSSDAAARAFAGSATSPSEPLYVTQARRVSRLGWSGQDGASPGGSSTSGHAPMTSRAGPSVSSGGSILSAFAASSHTSTVAVKPSRLSSTAQHNSHHELAGHTPTPPVELTPQVGMRMGGLAAPGLDRQAREAGTATATAFPWRHSPCDDGAHIHAHACG
jgi:hypothetical protein